MFYILWFFYSFDYRIRITFGDYMYRTSQLRSREILRWDSWHQLNATNHIITENNDVLFPVLHLIETPLKSDSLNKRILVVIANCRLKKFNSRHINRDVLSVIILILGLTPNFISILLFNYWSSQRHKLLKVGSKLRWLKGTFMFHLGWRIEELKRHLQLTSTSNPQNVS